MHALQKVPAATAQPPVVPLPQARETMPAAAGAECGAQLLAPRYLRQPQGLLLGQCPIDPAHAQPCTLEHLRRYTGLVTAKRDMHREAQKVFQNARACLEIPSFPPYTHCSLCDLIKSRFMLLGMIIISLWIQRLSSPAVLHVAHLTGLHVCTHPTASSRSAIATRTQRAGSSSKRRRPGNAAPSTGCANGSSTKLVSARTAAARTPGAAASYATSPAHHPCHGPGL